MGKSESGKAKEEFLQKIQATVEQADYSASLQLIEEYKESWEYSAEIAVMEGETYISIGQPDKAIRCIEMGLGYNSSNHELYFMLGEAYELLKNFECAELCYRYSIYQCHEKEDLTFLQENLDRLLNSFGPSLPRLSLLLRVSQNSDWLKLFLQMLLLYSIPNRYEIFFIEEHPSQTLHKLLSEQTLGTVIPCEDADCGSSYNLAIEMADKNSDIVIIEEGGLPLEHTFFTLQFALYQSHEAGCTGSISNQPHCSKYMVSVCPSASDAMEYAHQHNIPGGESPISSFDLPGPIYMFKRSFIKRYGWFDSEFRLNFYQLKEYLFRLVSNGKKVLLCPNSLSLQMTPLTPQWDSEELGLFKEKWNINLTYSCYSRDDLLSMIKKDSIHPDKPFHILEVGCACGATLIELGRRFSNAVLYGIELDDGPAAVASHFAKISNENIENARLGFPNHFFNFIIFGDVLEHLREPGKVLETMKDYLAEDGRILASIPNVMHISVMKPLLSGFWTYENAGILDQTHLKFFTYSEILRLFQNSGYQVEDVAATSVPISEEDEKLITRLAEIKNVPESWFQAYQYLVTAKKINQPEE